MPNLACNFSDNLEWYQVIMVRSVMYEAWKTKGKMCIESGATLWLTTLIR